MKENLKEELKKKFKIKIAFSEVNKQMEEDFLDLSKTLKLPGFRPGKIPISFVKNKYAKEVKTKVTEKLIQQTGNKEFEKKGYRLAAQPNVKLLSKIEENVDLEAEYEFEVLPNIILKDFNDIKLTKYVSKVTEKDIHKVIDNLFNQYKDFYKIKNERKSKKGDKLIISYKGFINEKLFEGGSAEKETIELGNNKYFPEFDKNLVDKSRNDKIEFFMKFPKDYNKEDLKDKKVRFNLIIHDILEGKKLKDEEELAAKTGSKNSSDLRDKIKKELQKYSDDLSFNVFKKALVSKLIGLYSFQLPDVLVSREIELLKSQKSSNNEKKINTDIDFKKEAEEKVKIGLIVSEIGIKNKINVTDKEVETVLAKICMQYPGKEKEIIEYYKTNANALNSLKGPIFEDKVMKFIEEKVNISFKEINSDDLLNMLSENEKKNKKKGENEK